MSLPQPQQFGPPGTTLPSPAGEWLTPLNGHWTAAALQQLVVHPSLVRITVVALRGSAPREPGASMLVDAAGTVGTIGGGQLEWRAIALARALLEESEAPGAVTPGVATRGAATARALELVLGPDLGQCCGGRVELWLERLTREDCCWLTEALQRLRAGRPTTLATELTQAPGCRPTVTHRLLPALPGAARMRFDRAADDGLRLLEPLVRVRPPLYLFGAGHVGQALVRLLADLSLFEIVWVDPRAAMLPADLPTDVRAVCGPPLPLARAAPPGTRFVVMTHDHALDYELCRAVLEREHEYWLGLIGSASKSARFRSRLARDGVPAAALSRLHCPIGIPRISSKQPAALAIAIAAQLLQTDAIDAAPAALAPAAAAPVADTEAPACAPSHACSSCGQQR